MSEEKDGAEARLENGERLDDDILIEILILLPAKSLAQFKSVCKKWYNFIQNPNFIKNHYNHPNNHNRLLFVHSDSKKDHNEISFTMFFDDFLSVQRKNIDFSSLSKNSNLSMNILKILGAVNGLCLVHYNYKEGKKQEFLCLWNPTTSEFRQLKFPSVEVSNRLATHYGFGCTDDDIKVVCITPILWFDDRRCVATLYSLANDCWKKIELDTNLVLKYIFDMTDCAYLNGATYWLIRKIEYNVVVFDMKTEVLREVPLPDEDLLYDEKHEWKCLDYDQLLVRNNSVVLFVTKILSDGNFDNEEIDCVDIWEMREEGCWNKIFSFVPSFYYSAPLGFWKDDEVIFMSGSGKLFLYNIHSNERRKLRIEATNL